MRPGFSAGTTLAANGRRSGTIPAFDATADRDHDGHLTDSEYARRRPGFDARFVHESRLFYPYYGQMRFVTNPSGAGSRLGRGLPPPAARRPAAGRRRVPGQLGRPVPAEPGRAVVESTDTYASDYAAVLGP